MRSRLTISKAAVVSCVILLASGCTTTQSSDLADVERGAQAVSEEDTQEDEILDVDSSAEENAAASVLENEVVGSIFRGVRLCVKNERTTIDGRSAAINVDLKSYSTTREGTFLLPTVENCAKTGQTLMLGTIQIMYTNARDLTLKVENLVTGPGQFELTRGVGGQACVYVSTEGQSKTYDDGYARYVLTRLNDSKDFKEFKLTVQDSRGETVCDSWS